MWGGQRVNKLQSETWLCLVLVGPNLKGLKGNQKDNMTPTFSGLPSDALLKV